MIKGRESNGDDVGCTSYVGMVNQRYDILIEWAPSRLHPIYPSEHYLSAVPRWPGYHTTKTENISDLKITTPKFSHQKI